MDKTLFDCFKKNILSCLMRFLSVYRGEKSSLFKKPLARSSRGLAGANLKCGDELLISWSAN